MTPARNVVVGASWAPGHAPEALEDSEYVDFSPTEEFRRVIEHITSGAGASDGKRAGPAAFLLTAAASIVAHEYFDAPVAQLLSDAGV